MTIVADDEYAGSASQILDTLDHGAHGVIDTRRISAILDAEHRKWVDFSLSLIHI